MFKDILLWGKGGEGMFWHDFLWKEREESNSNFMGYQPILT